MFISLIFAICIYTYFKCKHVMLLLSDTSQITNIETTWIPMKWFWFHNLNPVSWELVLVDEVRFTTRWFVHEGKTSPPKITLCVM